MNLVIMFLMWFLPQQPPGLGLKAELKQDSDWLKNGHIEYNRHVNFNVFKKYAEMDLSGFKFSTFAIGKHKVLKWISSQESGLKIYKVETTMPVDTAFEWAISDSVGSNGKKVTLTTDVKKTYHLVTYIIKPHYGKELIYISHKNGGLYMYIVGSKEVYPVYEEMDMYMNRYDKRVLNEIKQTALR